MARREEEDAVAKTVRVFVESAVGHPVVAKMQHESPVTEADILCVGEFIRLSAEQQQYLILREEAAPQLIRAISLPTVEYALRDAFLDDLWDVLSHSRLPENQVPKVARALCDICGGPTDGTRWRALRLFVRVSCPNSQDVPASLSVDTKLLMPRLLDSAFDMRVWLPSLVQAGLAVDTELVELRPEWSRALGIACSLSERAYFTQLAKTCGQSADSGTNWLEAGFVDTPPPTGTKEALEELSTAIDRAIATLRQRSPGCDAFVKLSTRSPKDSLALRTRKTLKVSNGREAIELLGCSKRVAEDVEATLASGLPLSVAVRKWCPVIMWSELRSFVCYRRITAISQYFAARHLPQLLQHKDALLSRVKHAFEASLAGSLPFENAVIDWALVGADEDDPQNLQLFALELNPFSRTTGACLFSWVDDINVLLYGPFTARFNEDH